MHMRIQVAMGYATSGGRGAGRKTTSTSASWKKKNTAKPPRSKKQKTNPKKSNAWKKKPAAGTTTRGKVVSSSTSTGCYTKVGKPIRNPAAYAATGAPIKTKSGRQVNSVSKYSRTVQSKSMIAAAKAAKKANPNAKAFSYTLQLDNGKRYIGYSANPEKRLKQHISGSGAEVTKELKPKSVTLTPHSSKAAAKKAETKEYHRQKKELGGNRVRGAGHTARFSKSRKKKF